MWELYRRTVFHALISNTDGHPRNHALSAPAHDFHHAPAYNLAPNALISAEKRNLAMQIGNFNRYANRANLLSAHACFKLSLDAATAIVDRIQATVHARRYAVPRENGTSEAVCERVSGAFDYPRFALDPKVVLETLR